MKIKIKNNCKVAIYYKSQTCFILVHCKLKHAQQFFIQYIGSRISSLQQCCHSNASRLPDNMATILHSLIYMFTWE